MGTEFLIVAGIVALIMTGFAWWARRRADEIDSVYERERQDPPVFDNRTSGGTGW